MGFRIGSGYSASWIAIEHSVRVSFVRRLSVGQQLQFVDEIDVSH